MNETVFIAGLEFEIRRSPRRKTLGLTVDRTGDLVVHAPESINADDLHRWIGRKLVWIHQKLAVKKDLAGAIQQPDFTSGESIFYLGRNYRLKLVHAQNEPLRFDGHWFFLRRRSRIAATQHFRQWYLDTGTPWIRRRVESWESRAGAAPSRVSVGDLGFRWGSCGKNGVLYFNWRLVQLPVRLIDYVLMHELAHLLERNHTPEFWRVMDRVLPDWRERKAELQTRWHGYVTFGMGVGLIETA